MIFGGPVPPFPPISNVGCTLGVPRAAKKKSVHAALVGLAFAPTLDIGGKGGQAFVIDSCFADFSQTPDPELRD